MQQSSAEFVLNHSRRKQQVRDKRTSVYNLFHAPLRAVLTQPVDVFTAWLDALEVDEAAGAGGGDDV